MMVMSCRPRRTGGLTAAGFSAIAQLALFFSVALPGHASANQEAVINQLIEKQKEIKTLSADFSQEKHSAMLTAPLVSKGQFTYKAPDKVAWIYTGQIQIVSDGKTLTIYYPEIEEAQVLPVQKSMISLPLNFNLEEFRRSFDLTAVEKGGLYRVSLAPIREKSMFARMVITLTPEGIPQSVEIVEKGGDRSIIAFKNQKVNKRVSEKIFSLDLPKGTVIRRYQE
ncbi:MAG: LolA family protein [bacterium]